MGAHDLSRNREDARLARLLTKLGLGSRSEIAAELSEARFTRLS